MIHSRPGFAPRRSDEAVAQLNDDMVPAIHRGAPKESTSLKQSLQSRAEVAHEKLKRAQDALNLAQAQAAAAKVGPDLLINPAPTEPPAILEPGK
jgi:hypothetical protein